MTTRASIVVAGHICLDLIPDLPGGAASLGEVLVPGALVKVGPALTATGGSVANVGVALHKLGYGVRLVGKVGDDAFGQVVLNVLRAHSPSLTDHMVVARGEHTSYTVVLSPPKLDRVFLHHTGCNDTFGADDVSEAHLAGAKLLHVGYPPLMRRLYRDAGQVVAIFEKAHRLGLATSLDMALPDASSEAGRVDWRAWLGAVLPHVDVFTPSVEELAFMLGDNVSTPGVEERIIERCLAMGAAVVALKCGAAGLRLAASNDAARLARLSSLGIDLNAWRGCGLHQPCFAASFVGATGSGDCTIAGLLAALVDGLAPQAAAEFACAVGACSVEAADATGGIVPADAVRGRLARGWPTLVG